jgi:hypothetical protein
LQFSEKVAEIDEKHRHSPEQRQIRWLQRWKKRLPPQQLAPPTTAVETFYLGGTGHTCTGFQ